MLMLFFGATPAIFATGFYTDIENLILNPGQTKSFSVGVESEDVISFKSFQFNIEIPEGIRLIDIKKSEALESFNLINNIEGEGLTGKKVIGIYDFVNGGSISGKTDLFLLTVQADNEITPAETSINFSKVIFGTNDGSDLPVGGNVVLPLTLFMPVSSISLNETSISLLKGYQFTLIPHITPENASDKTVTWESENPDIAIVNEKGLIIAVSGGETQISAKCGDKTAVCKVIVHDSLNITISEGNGTNAGIETNSPAVNTEKGASLIGNDFTLRVGQTGSLVLSIEESLIVSPELSWSLEENGKEFVSLTTEDNFNAKFVGEKEGKTKYLVRLNETGEIVVEGEITVIAEIPITSFRVSPPSAEFAENEDPFKLTVKDIAPSDATNQTLFWSSSNPDVATVSQEGILIPVKAGECEIIASTTDGSELSFSIEVTISLPIDPEFKFTIDGVNEIPGNKITLFKGQSIRVMPIPKEGYTLPHDLNWHKFTTQVSDLKAVSFEQEGVNAIFTAEFAGEVTFVAQGWFNETVDVYCNVNVKDDLMLKINPGNNTYIGDPDVTPAINTEKGSSLIGSDITLRVGQEAQLLATTDEDLTLSPPLVWKIGKEGSETVDLTTSPDNLNATFKGVAMGETEYSIFLQGNDQVKVSGKITVIAETPMKTMTINPSVVTLAQNAPGLKLTLEYTPQNVSDSNVIWTSNNPNIITVDSEGNITPLTVGETEIFANSTDGSCLIAECKVTISAPIDDAFEFEHDEKFMDREKRLLSIKVGDSFQLKPVAREGYVLPEELNWISDNEDIFRVNNNGVVQGVSEGAGIVKALATVHGNPVEVSYNVNVVRNSSGINLPDMEDSDDVTVYNLSGMKVKENIPLSELKTLNPGIYIVRKGQSSYKIAVK